MRGDRRRRDSKAKERKNQKKKIMHSGQDGILLYVLYRRPKDGSKDGEQSAKKKKGS